MIDEDEEREVSIEELSEDDWKNINEYYSSSPYDDDDE